MSNTKICENCGKEFTRPMVKNKAGRQQITGSVSGNAEEQTRAGGQGRADHIKPSGCDTGAADTRGEGSQGREQRGTRNTDRGGRKHMDQLSNFVAHSPRARQIQDGRESSKNPRGSRPRLNPVFVGWLQGNPWWWTNPARINCAASEIKLWRSRLRSRLSDLLGE